MKKDFWLEKLLKLIAIDNTNPPGKNYLRTIEFLEPLFKKVGFKTQRVKIPVRIVKGRVNLLAHQRNPGKPRLLIYSHIDVVSAEADWQPFKPKIKDGKIFARGVADMKGSIIAFLMAAEKGRIKDWDTTVMVTTDEETDQKDQMVYLLNEKIDRVRKAVFLDLDSTFGYVSIGGLGDVAARITVKGKSVHSGIAFTGVNAVEKSVPILKALLSLKTKVDQRFSKIPANPKLGIKTLKAGLNIDKINGGLKTNIVPDKCEIEIDRRLLPEEKIEEAKKEIVRTLSSLKKEIDFDLEFLHAMPGYGKESPLAEKFAGDVKEVTGKTGLYGVMGSGDLLAMAEEYDWQFVGCGVVRDKLSNIHGRKENARIKDIYQLAEVLTLFLNN